MNLIINNPDSLPLDEFCYWLIPYMQKYIKENIDVRRLKRWDDYINTNLALKNAYSIIEPISCKDIIIEATKNLRVYTQKDNYIIDINPVVFIPNTQAKFINIVQLINYGNLSLQGYKLFSDMMTYFADIIDLYYKMYLEEG
jgi:hypothetical protein